MEQQIRPFYEERVLALLRDSHEVSDATVRRAKFEALRWLRTVPISEGHRTETVAAITAPALRRNILGLAMEKYATGLLLPQAPESVVVDPDRFYQEVSARREQAEEYARYTKDLYRSGDLRPMQAKRGI